ncbi:S41 family peptidase [Pseudidiomarina insulisalsae]|uniref:Peptidase S41 n=1 Tax=Pseudidiomarina insulisalsae TaxID=575789 RepID=A0A432Y8M5_9GAMM|nr:S41 family peptidase [Pseudidiomarina insulisalsae]RUO57329.1 peptidase S41 [Pseudidiomarina insulisalsae]
MLKKSTRLIRPLVLCCAFPLLISCGGGSGDSSESPAADSCSVVEQNRYFLDYMRENYFWYEDIPANVEPASYDSVYALLDAIRSPQDRFSYILTEQEYQDRFVSAEYIGFGFSTRVVGSQLLLNYVFAESPAELAGMSRGDEILAIDGVAVATLIANGTLNQALGPAETGYPVTFTWQKPDGSEFTDVVTKVEVDTNTVLAIERFAQNGKDVGYYVLNSFIQRTGSDLNQAYDSLVGVDELIIDVRYNGGGLIRYANQAATQAAGDNVIGNPFVSLIYNDKNSDLNNTSVFQLVDGIQQLNLNRVFVLTTASSCSSSELIINGLKPFVDVVVIGGSTCGKPVGQSPRPFCDKRSFVINFETVNADGEGRYFDGIAPQCSAADTLVGDWGVNGDPLLDEAKYFISFGSCSASAMTLQSNEASTRRTQPRQHPLLEQWQNEF